jgi:putative transcriptional regulator
MDNTFFDRINIDLGTPSVGKILLSEPLLADPNFSRTVILLTEHNEDGTVGFVLNKPVDLELHDVIDEFPKFNGKLYMGGPVDNDRLYYLHTLGNKLADSEEVIDGLFWGGDFEALKTLIDTNQITPKDIRFFSGYSGWAEKQLDEEIADKAWIVASATTDQVMNLDIDSLWKNLMGSLGKKYSIMSKFPEDPSLN